MKFLKANRPILLYLILYSFLSLLTLSSFPFAHSDEPWLAGLSLQYLEEGSPFVTEPFFDLMPRQAHMIKSLFHGLQTIFIATFGYSLFSVRLLSWVCGLVILFLFHWLLKKQGSSPLMALLFTILLSLNLQFLYASHFARQEIVLGVSLMIGLLLLHKREGAPNRDVLWIGACVGISIGFHPNAFIIGTLIGAGLFYQVLMKERTLRDLFLYIGTLLFFAAIFVSLSLLGNPHFFTDYWSFGKTLAVDAAPINRLENFSHFYIKIFEQISGTYYLPDLKIVIVLSGLLILCATVVFFAPRRFFNGLKSNIGLWLSVILGYHVAVFIIGRYNPTSLFFVILPVFLLASTLAESIIPKNHFKIPLLILFILLSTVQTGAVLYDHRQDDYPEYLQEIAAHIPTDAIVLGNLNSGFAFEKGSFYDIRNLGFLEDMFLETYLKTRKIDTIIYYEAYDYIHRNPQWQILYGDDTAYYDPLNQVIKKTGTLLHQFESPRYGNRIVKYMGDYPWKVWIYHIDLDRLPASLPN